MKIRKIVSIIIASLIMLPCLARSVNAEAVVSLCVNSGITNYYNSISKAAFGMVNAVLQDFFDIAKASQKKEVPPKPKNENHLNGKAIISGSGIWKTFKTNLLPGIPLAFDISKDIYVSKSMGDGSFVSLGWIILLISMLILPVRKKDNDEVSFKYSITKRPIVL